MLYCVRLKPDDIHPPLQLRPTYSMRIVRIPSLAGVEAPDNETNPASEPPRRSFAHRNKAKTSPFTPLTTQDALENPAKAPKRRPRVALAAPIVRPVARHRLAERLGARHGVRKHHGCRGDHVGAGADARLQQARAAALEGADVDHDAAHHEGEGHEEDGGPDHTAHEEPQEHQEDEADHEGEEEADLMSRRGSWMAFGSYIAAESKLHIVP